MTLQLLNTVASSEMQPGLHSKITSSHTREWLVAGESYIETLLFVAALGDWAKEQPSILLTKGTVANLVNKQTRGAYTIWIGINAFRERLAAVNRAGSLQ